MNIKNKFFEVFWSLKVPEELYVYMEDTHVVRVSKTSTNSMAKIYIESDRLIEKPVLYHASSNLLFNAQINRKPVRAQSASRINMQIRSLK